jgi:ubiquinone biosynthesis protein UbiJ
LKKNLVPPLSKVINAYLNLDPESKQRVRKLQGKVIAIEFLPFHIQFNCVFNEDKVTLIADELIAADASLRGTPLQMLGVMIAKENRHRFFADDLVMEGDAAFGQQVVELFDHMKIDWEEHLSKLTGDVPAYHLGRIAGKFKSWLNTSQESFSQNINDYVHEEARWLPSREALQDFFTDIDTLRMDLDRLEAHIKNLTAKITDQEVKP